jgi:hypothetical protein
MKKPPDQSVSTPISDEFSAPAIDGKNVAATPPKRTIQLPGLFLGGMTWDFVDQWIERRGPLEALCASGGCV